MCVCEREKKEKDVMWEREEKEGVYPRERVCACVCVFPCVRENERGRVLPAQSDQCFGLSLAMWITAPTTYWILITGN